MLRIVDGPIAPLPCLSKTAYERCPDCPDEATCAVRRAFAEVADATREVLARRSVADAASGRFSLAEVTKGATREKAAGGRAGATP